MKFSELTVHSDIIAKLKTMIDENRVSHAMLFSEDDGQGAIALITAMIQYMSCRERSGNDSCGKCPECVKVSRLIHPDIHYVFPTAGGKNNISEEYYGPFRNLFSRNPYFLEDQLNEALGTEDKLGAISVAESRNILRLMSYKSYEGNNKYLIIYLPEKMSTEASNRLLKLIEEPAEGTYFFMITHTPENVLATVKSRCLRVNMRPMDTADLATALGKATGADLQTCTALARISGGNFGKAIAMSGESGRQSTNLKTTEEILTCCLEDNLPGLLEISARLAGEGREKQKQFFIYFEEFIRKVFVSGLGLEEIAYGDKEESLAVTKFKTSLTAGFCEEASRYTDNARIAAESNVNAKMVFNNFVNLIYILYRKTNRKQQLKTE